MPHGTGNTQKQWELAKRQKNMIEKMGNATPNPHNSAEQEENEYQHHQDRLSQAGPTTVFQSI